MSEFAVETKGLGRRFGRQWAVRDVSLTLEQGTVLGILGRNGAGKTTLMDLIVGLLRPSCGSLSLFGAGTPQQRACLSRQIAYVDELKTLYDYLSVGELTDFVRNLAPLWSERLAANYIQLSPKLRVGDLSAGQRAQFAFALAACRRPRLLLVDEPTSHLDPIAAQQLLRAIIEDCVGEGTTVLIASHELEETAQVSDRVALIDRGTIRHEVSLADMEENYQLIVAVLGGPAHSASTSIPATLPGLIHFRAAGGTLRYLVRGKVERLAEHLRAVGQQLLQTQPVRLRTLYFELLESPESDGGPVAATKILMEKGATL